MSATISGKVDSIFEKLESDLATRAEVRRGKSRKTWREMCAKMAAGGGELSVSELGKLEEAASDLGIRPDDLHEKFVQDIETLQRVEMLRRETVDFDRRAGGYEKAARKAADELEHIRSVRIRELEGIVATNQCLSRSLHDAKAEIDRLVKGCPDLFDSPEA